MSSGPQQPEVFLDRCLGKGTAEELRGLGWLVHTVHDHFPNEGEDASDEEWIAYGVNRGWVMLTKDKRIRYRAEEIGALASGHIVCLSNGQLKRQDAVNRFDAARDAIVRQTSTHPVGFWHVGEDGRLNKMWP
jgi:hypothetical protein